MPYVPQFKSFLDDRLNAVNPALPDMVEGKATFRGAAKFRIEQRGKNPDPVALAVDYIRDNARSIAVAKATRVYLEEYRKTKKALLVQKAKGTVQEKDAFAYAHPEYIEVLDGLRVAVEEEETFKWMMLAAETKVQLWQTQSANERRY